MCIVEHFTASLPMATTRSIVGSLYVKLRLPSDQTSSEWVRVRTNPRDEKYLGLSEQFTAVSGEKVGTNDDLFSLEPLS
jgi:hypothetical protein